MTVGPIFTKIYIFISLSWTFFENRKNSGLTSGQMMTRWPGRERWPKWPIDPVTQWPSSMSANRVSRYQKGKTNLDFTEARDSEWQWHQLGHMQVCKSAPCSRQTTTPAPHHSVFYRPDALTAAQPTASKHWRHTPLEETAGKQNTLHAEIKKSCRQNK